jgi:hypothetical protein
MNPRAEALLYSVFLHFVGGVHDAMRCVLAHGRHNHVSALPPSLYLLSPEQTRVVSIWCTWLHRYMVRLLAFALTTVLHRLQITFWVKSGRRLSRIAHRWGMRQLELPPASSIQHSAGARGASHPMLNGLDWRVWPQCAATTQSDTPSVRPHV